MPKTYVNTGVDVKAAVAGEMAKWTNNLIEKEYGGSKQLWTHDQADHFANVSLEDLLYNDYFLNAKSWLWEKNAEIIQDLWEERKKRRISLAVILGSIGNGKTSIMSLITWLLWMEVAVQYDKNSLNTIPQEFFGLRPTSKIAIISLSKTVKKAKEVMFNEVKSSFTTGFNRDYFPHNKKITSMIDIERNNTIIFPNTATAAGNLGYNVYCLSGNQKIVLANGESVELKQMENIGELNLKGFDIKRGKFVNIKADNVIKTGSKEIFEVELEDGSKIECTEDHPFLVYKYNNIKNKYEFKYKSLNQITEKDEILTNKDFVECKLCKNLYTQINQTHLIKYHNISLKGYKAKFPNSLTASSLISYRISQIRKNKYPHGSRGIGWHHSDEVKEKIAESNKGKIISEETRIKMSEFQKGKIISEKTKEKLRGQIPYNKGKTLEELHGVKKAKIMRKEMSERSKGKIPSVETRKIWSEQRKGKNNPRYGKPAVHGKISYYKEYRMRSSWEVTVAKYLDSQNILWEYESKTFELRDLDGIEMTYTPDFYLPEYDLFIEVKGYWRGKAFIKYTLFSKNHDVFLIQKKEMKNLDCLLEVLERRISIAA